MGHLFTFSGPRGVGKTTLMDDVRSRLGIKPIVPFTTRDPRPGEIDGRDYHFVTDQEFDAIRRSKGMFDVLTLRKRMYGTPLEEFDHIQNSPSGSIEHVRTINLAAASALELRRELGKPVVGSIFVLPQSWNDIERQMREKGIPERQILERRSAEPTDLTMLPEFDHLVINGYGRREQALGSIASFMSDKTGIIL